MSKTKVHRAVLLIVDTDDIGESGIRDVIPNTRYPNRCIAPEVMNVETREVAWDDHHPLNSKRTQREAFDELFAQDEELAKLRAEIDEVRTRDEIVLQQQMRVRDDEIDELRAALGEALELAAKLSTFIEEDAGFGGSNPENERIAELRKLVTP